MSTMAMPCGIVSMQASSSSVRVLDLAPVRMPLDLGHTCTMMALITRDAAGLEVFRSNQEEAITAALNGAPLLKASSHNSSVAIPCAQPVLTCCRKGLPGHNADWRYDAQSCILQPDTCISQPDTCMPLSLRYLLLQQEASRCATPCLPWLRSVWCSSSRPSLVRHCY